MQLSGLSFGFYPKEDVVGLQACNIYVKPVPLPCNDWGEDQLIREAFFASVPMPFLLPRVVAIVSSP